MANLTAAEAAKVAELNSENPLNNIGSAFMS